jgi:hypothetical protein
VAAAINYLVAHSLKKAHQTNLRRHSTMVAADGNPHEKLPDDVGP